MATSNPSSIIELAGPSREPPAPSEFDPANPDTIIRASLLADSQAPDGGYGWVVISACSVLTFWFVGTTYSWGVLQAALAEQYLSAPSTLAFIGSLTVTCISLLAIVNARMIRAMGARNAGLVGVALLGAGGILSGFSTGNLGGLFVTTGVIEGVGTRYGWKKLPLSS
jgi:hypothetical protein